MENENDAENPAESDANSKEYLSREYDEVFLTPKERFCMFLRNHWSGVFAFLSPIILLPVLLPFPPQKHQWCGYTLLLMAVFWVSECIPLPVTSFLPVFIFPLTGVMTTQETCKTYYNDTIFMFLGSLILATAIEQSGLHKRLALCAIRMIGYSHYKLLFAMSFITMFVSMWITNTAATTMMVPINFALLKVFEGQGLLKLYEKTSTGETVASDITTCYFCTATFSATIGGIGTLVGTATNLVFKGLYQRQYPQSPEYLSFPNFSAFAVPYMLVMESFMYLCMITVYFGFLRPNSALAKAAIIPPKALKAAEQAVESDWKKLGKITFWELMVIILFSGAMIGFFCRSPQIFTGWGDIIYQHFEKTDPKFVKDSALAMMVCFLMLLLPSTLAMFKNWKADNYENLPKGRVSSVLDWKNMDATFPYSFVFLLGGGFALSSAMKSTGLNSKLGEFLGKLKDLPNILILFFIILFTTIFTNFASNVAVCNVVAPISMQLATEVGQHALWYNIAAGFTSSYAFCLPVGTPGNLVVQSAAKIPTKKMLIAGAAPTVTTIIISWLAISFWAPVIWPDIINAAPPVATTTTAAPEGL